MRKPGLIIYRTRSIISFGLYIFYPISKDHFFVFKEVFPENSVLMYSLYSRAAYDGTGMVNNLFGATVILHFFALLSELLSVLLIHVCSETTFKSDLDISICQSRAGILPTGLIPKSTQN